MSAEQPPENPEQAAAVVHFSWRICLAGRSLTTFPEDRLSSVLVTLDLTNNKILIVPASIALLSNLQHLSLGSNLLTSLPSVAPLTSLLTLDLSNNRLERVPELNTLSLLWRLDIQKNLIAEVPMLSILERAPHGCGNLHFLFIRGNPFHSRVWAVKGAAHPTLAGTVQGSGEVCVPAELKDQDIANSTALRRLSFLEGKLSSSSFPDLILPGLYVSNQLAAENSSVLEHLRISHVVRVVPGFLRTKGNFQLMHIRVLDNPDVKLSSFFKPVCDFIDKGRQIGAVLVHCQMGISRSAAMITAYVMYHTRMSYKQSLSFVKRLHPCRPNSSFAVQLQEWGHTLGVEAPPS